MKHLTTLKKGIALLLFAAATTTATAQNYFTSVMIPKQETQLRKAPALLHAPIARATDNEDVNVLVDEDFSLMTAGTNDTPDTTPLVEISDDMDWKIDPALTHNQQWYGVNCFQAGGAVALITQNNINGQIISPFNNYSGMLTIRIRVKAIGQPTRVFIEPGKGGLTMKPIDGMPQYKMQLVGTDDWTEMVMEVENKSSDPDGAVEVFTQGSILLDHITVTTSKNYLAYPPILPITNMSATEFTANWQAVPTAESYLFSLFRKNFTTEGNAEYKLDFEDLELPTEGWIFKMHNDEPFTGNEGEDNSAGLVMENADTIVVIQNNSLYKNLRFYAKTYGASATQLENSFIRILVDNNYVQGGLLGNINLNQTVNGLQVDMEEATGGNFADYYSRIQLIAMGLPEGAYLVIDNIEVETGRAATIDPVINNDETTNLYYTVTNLDPDGYYYYSVKSKKGDKTVESPLQTIYYVPVPLINGAKDITDDSYTATWEPVAKATKYEVRNFFAAEVPVDYPQYHIIAEDFSYVNSEITQATDPQQPENLGNQAAYLDGLTHVNGWIGQYNTLCQGMMGCSAIVDDYAYMVTPALDLSNNDGNFQIQLKAYGKVGDQICIYDFDNFTPGMPEAMAEFEPITPGSGEGTPGYFEGTLNLTGGTVTKRLVLMTNGMPWMLDEINVLQDLKQGDMLSRMLDEQFVNAPQTEYTFTNLKHYDVDTFYYTVRAVSEDPNYYYSGEMSNYIKVQLVTDGINTPLASSNLPTLEPSQEVFDLNGRRMTPGTALPKGIYIIKKNGKNEKVVLR